MTSTAELSSPASASSLLTRGVVDHDYTLEDKFARTRGRIYLSGVQALVRLPLMQRLRDGPRGSTPAASSPATGVRRWAASTSSCGARASTWTRPG